jgi:hypothetical protein
MAKYKVGTKCIVGFYQNILLDITGITKDKKRYIVTFTVQDPFASRSIYEFPIKDFDMMFSVARLNVFLRCNY